MAMARVVLDEGLENKEFVSTCTDGLGGLKESLSAQDIAAAVRDCGISEDQLRKAARVYAKSAPAAANARSAPSTAGRRRCLRLSPSSNWERPAGSVTGWR
jgi:anaerobic selenocysteine-containing dehydrogenase